LRRKLIVFWYVERPIKTRATSADSDMRIQVGIFTENLIDKRLDFEHLSHFTINSDGSWTNTYASCRDVFPRNWNAIWAPRSHDYATFKLACAIMDSKLWDAGKSQWDIAYRDWVRPLSELVEQ